MFPISILDIKTTGTILKEMASSVVLPGEEGQLTIMDFHQSIVACLKKGIVNVDEQHFIHIKKGIARMEGNKLFILAEQ